MATIIAFFCGTVNPAQARQPVILAFGDSLTAGYGLRENQSLPAQLEAALQAEYPGIVILNGGVSGDTTAGGLSRLEWSLKEKPDAVILALGANDMLRGTNPKITQENLRKMMDILKARDIPVLLAGMRSFTNLGPGFGAAYDSMYKKLAKDYNAVYYPFLLDGVALQANLNLEDGLHPNAAGIGVIVEKITPSVKELITRVPQ